jgi:hypothetical protein
MERRSANALRILGIVATVILVIAGCCLLLLIAWLVFIRGGLTRNAMIFHPRAANSFVGALLAAIALVTTGVLIIRKLAREMGRHPAHSLPHATISGPAAASSSGLPPGPSLRSPGLRSVSHRLSPRGRKTIDRLVLALGARIAIGAVVFLQVASRAFVPRHSTLDLLPGLILARAPDTILIYALLKRPGRRTFTFLIALLAIPILQTLFNPRLLFSYGRIYTSYPIGLFWPFFFSGLIYVVILALAYRAIEQNGLWPTPSSVILATVATFFYFFFVSVITPPLYGLWR